MLRQKSLRTRSRPDATSPCVLNATALQYRWLRTGNERDSFASASNRRMVASPDDWPTAIRFSLEVDQSNARKRGTSVRVESTSCRSFCPLKPVTLHRRNDLPVTSTERKRCSAAVELGDQRMADSIMLWASRARSSFESEAAASSRSTCSQLAKNDSDKSSNRGMRDALLSSCDRLRAHWLRRSGDGPMMSRHFFFAATLFYSQLSTSHAGLQA